MNLVRATRYLHLHCNFSTGILRTGGSALRGLGIAGEIRGRRRVFGYGCEGGIYCWKMSSSSSSPPTSSLNGDDGGGGGAGDGRVMFGPFEVGGQVFYKTRLSYALVNIRPVVPGHVLVIPFRMVSRFTDLTVEEITDIYVTVQKVQRVLAAVYFHPHPSSTSSTSPDPPIITTSPPTPTPNPDKPPSTIPHPPTSPSFLPSTLQSPSLLTTGGFNIAMQDGPESGQTVPHVHCHILPRLRGNTIGDAIYDRIHGEEGNVGGALWDAWLTSRPRPEGRLPEIEEAGRVNRSVEEMNAEAGVLRGWMRVFDELDESRKEQK